MTTARFLLCVADCRFPRMVVVAGRESKGYSKSYRPPAAHLPLPLAAAVGVLGGCGFVAALDEPLLLPVQE